MNNIDDKVCKHCHRLIGEVPPHYCPKSPNHMHEPVEQPSDDQRKQESLHKLESMGLIERVDQCGHVPARPDVNLTLCWKCGVEVVPDPDTHLWRPLTEAERLVKYETIREIQELALRIPPAELHCVLSERMVIQERPAIRLAENPFGCWFICNGNHEDLAWSGSRWVPHSDGLPRIGPNSVQICNFASREEAKEYAEEHFPKA